MAEMAGGRIELVSLTKRFAEIAAVDEIDLTISSGEFFSLLGPSGCGKTTTLRLIAGFEQPTAGRILLDDVDVSGIPPHKRNVNTVFQSYALFPFLTVFDNVAFGLRNRGWTRSEPSRRVGAALDLVQLGSSRKRRPGQLSGGQQQRVALARALVLQPSVLLLDEPLGALDAKLRRSLKVELKALQEQVGITFLYVTHDQEEALTMSDRLAVMRDGKIVQIGSPHARLRGARGHLRGRLPRRVQPHGGGRRLARPGLGAARPSWASPCCRWSTAATGTPDRAHAVIRPERVRVEEFGSRRPEPGPRDGRAAGLPGLVHPGHPAPGARDGAAGAAAERRQPAADLAQGTPVHAFLAPDALRVLAGGGQVPTWASPRRTRGRVGRAEGQLTCGTGIGNRFGTRRGPGPARRYRAAGDGRYAAVSLSMAASMRGSIRCRAGSPSCQATISRAPCSNGITAW